MSGVVDAIGVEVPLPSDDGIDAIGVGVPARDEAEVVAACVAALDEAAATAGAPVHLVVVADGCNDATVAVASAALASAATLTGRVVATAPLGVGRARSLALDLALGDLAVDPQRTWLATTDADTTVGPVWFSGHRRWARAGYDAVTGLVEVAFAGDDEGPAALRYRASLVPDGVGVGHRHVHGANLGVRGSWWSAVGGCGDGSCGEDHELWRRLRQAGARVIGVDDLSVVTSGRLEGRVEGGFASYLATLATHP